MGLAKQDATEIMNCVVYVASGWLEVKNCFCEFGLSYSATFHSPHPLNARFTGRVGEITLKEQFTQRSNAMANR